MADRILAQIWRTLSVIKNRAVEFTMYCSSIEVVQGLLNDIDEMEVADAWAEMLDSPEPLTTEAWLKLPAAIRGHYTNHWIIYFILLQKPDHPDKAGHPDKVYCGSGTCGRHGSNTRSSQYDTSAALSVRVNKALAAGYQLTHKGILLRFPLPHSLDQPKGRLIMLILEATFTYLFRANQSCRVHQQELTLLRAGRAQRLVWLPSTQQVLFCERV